MADDIAQWLERLGLGRYARAFADNGVDFDIVPRLSDDRAETQARHRALDEARLTHGRRQGSMDSLSVKA